ncbi:MAG TPA: metallophosphatase domain-containing protein [Candidatus Melainabacteria bacterium]|nr:metallophosphatase domain-containing protein [Candidatus Melainabacteria bacterium]
MKATRPLLKVVAISDIHNRTPELPEGDLLVVAGDLSSHGSREELSDINHYLIEQSHKFKHKPVIIAGNHDRILEKHGATGAAELMSAGFYLQDDLLEIDGIRIWGSPWTPQFMNWSFMKERGEDIKTAWDKIPEGIDLLITHGPPESILDLCPSGNVGCEELRITLTERLKSPPAVHVFGHIHEAYGEFVLGRTRYYNVSICDGRYRPTNAPTLIEI